jgi:hypothetical protein
MRFVLRITVHNEFPERALEMIQELPGVVKAYAIRAIKRSSQLQALTFGTEIVAELFCSEQALELVILRITRFQGSFFVDSADEILEEESPVPIGPASSRFS